MRVTTVSARCFMTSSHLLEELARLGQVPGVEALGERGVRRCQEGASLGRAVVVAEEAGVGGRDAELVDACALPSRDGESVAERGFDLRCVVALDGTELGAATERVGAPDVLPRHGALGLAERRERACNVAR